MINRSLRKMWPALRVLPPALPNSAELSWILVRAFAAPESTAPKNIDGRKVLALAEQLDLAERIATRHAATLFEQLGAAAARQMTAQRLRSVAVDRVLAALVDELLAVAKDLAVPVVLLKHAALRRRGFVAEGERQARDVDLLVDPTQAARLQAGLIERGFASAEFTPVHHLPTLTRGRGEVVEIHHKLWGIHLAHPRDDAAAASLPTALTWELPDGSQTLSQALMAVHAVVHGLIQHRSSPEGYPSMRAIADLCAINWREADVEDKWRALLPKPDHAQLMRAAVCLSRALTDGMPTDGLRDEERALLSHVVAASTNAGYRRALHFERVFDGDTLREVPSTLWRALLGPSRARRPADWAPPPHAAPGTASARTAELLEDARSYVAFTLRRGR